MDLRHLRYFLAVAEERHFGRAAARLHMAQPPLSQAVRQLEDELGVQLLVRTTRRVELTPAGVAYRDSAREILSAVEAATSRAQRVAAGLSGRLTIGCVGSATYSLLPAYARRLREQLPGVDVSFVGEMLVPEQVAALLERRIDLALLRPPVDEPALRLHPLRKERLVVALPEDHPLAARSRLTVKDLADLDLVVHPGHGRSVMHSLVVRLFAESGVAPRVRHEVAETSTLVTFVAAGLGAAVVPEPVTALVVPGATYRPLATGSARVELSAAVRVQDDVPSVQPALAVLADLVSR